MTLPHLPDALVLGGGGTLGEAWMRGVLAGIEAERDDLDFRRCEYLLGTSAGSIVAAVLAAGRRPDAGEVALSGAPADAPAALPVGAAGALVGAGRLAQRAGHAIAGPIAGRLGFTAAPGALARAALLRAVPPGRHDLGGLGAMIDALGAKWDGRLRIATVDETTGRRVVFGAPGAPDASVSEAVLASCSIPGVFPGVEIGGRAYVDGGVWSPANLDAIPTHRGTQVLCLHPMGEAGPLPRLVRAATAREVAMLRGRGVALTMVSPDPAAARAIGRNLMDGSKTSAALAAGVAQGRALAAAPAPA